MKSSQADANLITVNTCISELLNAYISESVDIRFDIPDPQEPPAQPTVSVFLYDIQEDLQLRHGESRQFMPATGKMAPGTVQVRCCYLITYWDSKKSSSSDGPDTGPGSQSMVVMNEVLNALVNNRHLSALPGSYTRVIPPSEHLNSLGNFWQSLGNKPRLCLSYAVTFPLRLSDKKSEEYPPVKAIAAGLDNKPPIDVEAAAAQALRETLVAQLRVGAAPDQAIRPLLAKVVIDCSVVRPPEEAAQAAGAAPASVRLNIGLSGVTSAALHARIASIVTGWPGGSEPVCVIQGMDVFVDQADYSGLVGIASEA